MQCPQCQTTVPPGFNQCPHCRADLNLWQKFQQFKQAVRELNQDSTQLSLRLSRLQTEIGELEPLLSLPSSDGPRPEAVPTSAPSGQSMAPPPIIPVMKPAATAPSSPTPASVSSNRPVNWPVPVVPGAVRPPSSDDDIPATGTKSKPRPTTEAPSLPARAAPPSATEVWVGQKWLLVVGIVSTVLSVGYFVKYSFDRNWVTETGRVILAYFTSLSLMAFGEWFRRRRLPAYGLSLIGGGVAALYVSTFAAFQVYHLMAHTVAFVILVGITVLAGAMARHYDNLWLAVLGLIGGFLTPVVLNTGQDNQAALMTYMTMLSGGVLWLGFYRRWALLNYLAFGCNWLLFASWYGQHYSLEKFWLTTVFLNLFFLIYTLAPFAYFFVHRHPAPLSGHWITGPNALLTLGFAHAMIRGYSDLEYVSLATLAYAAVFLGLAGYLRQSRPENRGAMVLFTSYGLIFLVITVPFLFSAQWITVFWMAQAVVLIGAGLRLPDRWIFRGALLLLMLVLLKFVFHDYPEVFGFNLHEFTYTEGFAAKLLARWFTAATVLAGLQVTVRLLREAQAETVGLRRPELLQLNSTVQGLFVILLFAALNLEVSAFFQTYAPNARFASISVLWTLFSVALMILGFLRRQSILRLSAFVLLAATVFKVFLFDMADVRTPFRIISFFVLGLVLIGASYLYYRYKDQILPAETRTEIRGAKSD